MPKSPEGVSEGRTKFTWYMPTRPGARPRKVAFARPPAEVTTVYVFRKRVSGGPWGTAARGEYGDA